MAIPVEGGDTVVLRMRPGWTVFLALAACGFTGLVVLVSWIVGTRDGAAVWQSALAITGIVLFFALVLIAHFGADAGSWVARLPFWWRVGARITRLFYGSPVALPTAPLDQPFHTIVAALNRHRPGLTHP